MKSTETKTETKTKRQMTGKNATTIFVYWQDAEGEKGIADFTSKPALDEWLRETNVTVLRVIRGRERKIARKIIFQ